MSFTKRSEHEIFFLDTRNEDKKVKIKNNVKRRGRREKRGTPPPHKETCRKIGVIKLKLH